MSQTPSSMPPDGSKPLEAIAFVPVSEAEGVPTRTGLARTSMALGIVAIPALCALGLGALVGLVAVVVGSVALVLIARRPLVYGGKGYALVGIGTGLLSILALGLCVPALSSGKQMSSKTVCAANLTGIMKSLIIYSSDNNDYYPYLGTTTIEAMPPVNPTPTKFVGGCLMNDVYYLVGTGVVSPKQFVCQSDRSAINSGNSATATGHPPYAPPYWNSDFGYSYSFAYQYSDHNALGNYWKNTMDSAVAIGADLNPGNAAAKFRGNSPNHLGDGQNVVYADCHVDYQRTPNCGEAGDGIYTTGKATGGTVGMPGLPLGASGNAQGTFDTCLVPGVVDATSMRRE